MPPKGAKSPRTKSPKGNKAGAGGAAAWETLLGTMTTSQVRIHFKKIYDIRYIIYILINRIIGQHLSAF